MMSMCLPLKNKHFSVCILQLFKLNLQKKTRSTAVSKALLSADDKVIILDDFNARVGQDADSWKEVLSRHSIGNCNDNRHLLLELGTEQQLFIKNIIQRKDRLKTTWMHPRSKHWHLIDYVLAHKCDHKCVIHTKVMPSTECHTDHHLVSCTSNLSPEREFKSSIWTNLSAEVKADF